MAEVALSETIDADLGTLFEFQADPEASAMAAFPSRDLPAFLERQASGSGSVAITGETATRPRPCARSSTSTSTGRCTPTWPTTTSVPGACSRRAASKLERSVQEEDVLEHVLVLTD